MVERAHCPEHPGVGTERRCRPLVWEVLLQFSPVVPATDHRGVVPGHWHGDHQILVGETVSHVLNGEQSLPRYGWLVNAQHEASRVQSDVEAHDATKIGGM